MVVLILDFFFEFFNGFFHSVVLFGTVESWGLHFFGQSEGFMFFQCGGLGRERWFFKDVFLDFGFKFSLHKKLELVGLFNGLFLSQWFFELEFKSLNLKLRGTFGQIELLNCRNKQPLNNWHVTASQLAIPLNIPDRTGVSFSKQAHTLMGKRRKFIGQKSEQLRDKRCRFHLFPVDRQLWRIDFEHGQAFVNKIWAQLSVQLCQFLLVCADTF
jgi:hypothetical protein